jgi:hypothetical protein
MPPDPRFAGVVGASSSTAPGPRDPRKPRNHRELLLLADAARKRGDNREYIRLKQAAEVARRHEQGTAVPSTRQSTEITEALEPNVPNTIRSLPEKQRSERIADDQRRDRERLAELERRPVQDFRATSARPVAGTQAPAVVSERPTTREIAGATLPGFGAGRIRQIAGPRPGPAQAPTIGPQPPKTSGVDPARMAGIAHATRNKASYVQRSDPVEARRLFELADRIERDALIQSQRQQIGGSRFLSRAIPAAATMGLYNPYATQDVLRSELSRRRETVTPEELESTGVMERYEDYEKRIPISLGRESAAPEVLGELAGIVGSPVTRGALAAERALAAPVGRAISRVGARPRAAVEAIARPKTGTQRAAREALEFQLPGAAIEASRAAQAGEEPLPAAVRGAVAGAGLGGLYGGAAAKVPGATAPLLERGLARAQTAREALAQRRAIRDQRRAIRERKQAIREEAAEPTRPLGALAERERAGPDRGPGVVALPGLDAVVGRGGDTGAPKLKVELAHALRDDGAVHIEARVPGQTAPVGILNVRNGVADVAMVQPKARRRGVATQMYDYAGTVLGKPLKPSSMQSADSKAFWAARGEKVAESEPHPLIGVVVTPARRGGIGEEKIVAAASKAADGRVFTGQIHYFAEIEAQARGASGPYTAGFVTNTGRFVTRAEAMEVAKKTAPEAAHRAEMGGFRKGRMASEDFPVGQLSPEAREVEELPKGVDPELVEWRARTFRRLQKENPSLKAREIADKIKELEGARRGGVGEVGGKVPRFLEPERIRGTADQLGRQLVKSGGFTFDPRTGAFVEKGYAVGAGKLMGKPKETEGPPTMDDLGDFLEENAELFAREPQAVIGGWRDSETGKVTIEPSIVYANRNEALRRGRKLGEKAIGDLAAYAKGEPGDIPAERLRYEIINRWPPAYLETSGKWDPEGPEKIVAAATATPEGKTWVAPVHHEAQINLRHRFKDLNYRDLEDGFATNKGRFLDRDEAAELVRGKGAEFLRSEEVNPWRRLGAIGDKGKIRAAAVLIDGKVYEGATHSDARDAAYTALGGKMPDKFEHGFATDKGEYVSRDEALEIAKTTDPKAAERAQASADRFNAAAEKAGMPDRARANIIAEDFPFAALTKYGRRRGAVGALKEKRFERTVEEVSEIIARRRPAAEGTVKEQIKTAVRRGIVDVMDALDKVAHAAEWYKADIGRLEEGTKRMFPETRDPGQMKLFKLITAITSSGLDPLSNLKTTVAVYDNYLKTDRLTMFELDAVVGKGKGNQPVYRGRLIGPGSPRQNTHETHLRAVQEYIDQHSDDLDGALERLYTETAVERTALGRPEGAFEEEAPRVVTEFGDWKKIGRFYANLNGVADEVTVDVWATRTLRGWLGISGAGAPSGREVLVMRKAVTQLAKDVSQTTGRHYDPMDIQALLWYYEKRRYFELGAAESGEISYADATRQIEAERSQGQLFGPTVGRGEAPPDAGGRAARGGERGGAKGPGPRRGAVGAGGTSREGEVFAEERRGVDRVRRTRELVRRIVNIDLSTSPDDVPSSENLAKLKELNDARWDLVSLYPRKADLLSTLEKEGVVMREGVSGAFIDQHKREVIDQAYAVVQADRRGGRIGAQGKTIAGQLGILVAPGVGAAAGAALGPEEWSPEERAAFGAAIGLAGGTIGARALRDRWATLRPRRGGFLGGGKGPIREGKGTPYTPTPDQAVNFTKFAQDLDPDASKELADEVDKLIASGKAEKKRVTWAETDKLAQELGIDPDQIVARERRLSGAEMLALRNLVSENVDRVAESSRQLMDPRLSDDSRRELQEQIGRLTGRNEVYLSRFIKERSQAGRDLNNLKIIAKKNLDVAVWIAQAQRLKAVPLTQAEIDKVTTLAREKKREELVAYVSGFRKTGPLDKLLTLWKAGLLTSPTTHIANVGGNLSMAALETAKEPLAGVLDYVISMARGDVEKFRSKDVTAYGLITAQAKGLTPGARAAWKILKTGASPRDLEKWDIRKARFESPVLQAYTDIVFNTLGAEDALFRGAALGRSLHENARLRLRAMGLKPGDPAFQKELDALTSKPDDELMTKSTYDAELATFQNDNPMAKHLTSYPRYTERAPFTRTLYALTLPFVRTPSNIALRLIDYTPAGFLTTLARQVADPSQKKLAEGLARTMTGSALLY